MKNKVLSVILALFMLVPCVIMFSACDKEKDPRFDLNSKLFAEANVIVSNLAEYVYNSNLLETNTVYSAADIAEIEPMFEYYVEIASMNDYEGIRTITLGGNTMANGQTFKLSIGNGNYIEDKAFYSENNKLYAAAPIIVFEAVNSDSIIVNDVEFEYDFNRPAFSSAFKGVQFTGTINTLIGSEDEFGNVTQFDLTIKDCTDSYLKLYYNGANENDVILTKKQLVKGEINELSYGLTKVEAEEGNPIGFYPIGWDSELTQERVDKYNGATLTYTTYVVGGTISYATFNLNVLMD